MTLSVQNNKHVLVIYETSCTYIGYTTHFLSIPNGYIVYRQDIGFNPYFPLLSPTKPHNKKIQSLDRQISIQRIRHVHPKHLICFCFFFVFFVVFFSLLYRREEIVKWSRNVSQFFIKKKKDAS